MPRKKRAKVAKATNFGIAGRDVPNAITNPGNSQNEQYAVQSPPAQPVDGAPDWDTEDPQKPELTAKEKKKAAIDKRLTDWPWKGAPRKLVTAGPLYLNTWKDVLAKKRHNQQQSALMRVLVTAGIGELIIDLLFQHHSSIWQLAFTCQKAQSMVVVTADFWDLNQCHFNGCELEPTAEGNSQGKGLVAANLVIASLRSPTSVHLRVNNTLYESQLYNTYMLCKTVKYRAMHFRRVHFHLVPFLTTGLLSILIPQMTNLKVLGIYKCPLIHVGHGLELLNIIKSDRPKGKEHQVSLDWYPNYHLGPDPKVTPVHYHTGSYGVTWDNWQGPTDRAIWALVLPFIAQCKAQGIDAISPHTQFRRWLNASPCWDVENTLNAIVDAWGLHMPSTSTSRNKGAPAWTPEPRFPSGKRRKPLSRIEYKMRWPKLTKAIVLIDQRSEHHHGNPDKFFTINREMSHARPEGFEWMFKDYPCLFCENTMPGVFFHFVDIKAYVEATNYGAESNAAHDLICLGCRLAQYLNTEKDHYKGSKRSIDNYWREDGIAEDGTTIFNTADLDKLLARFEEANLIEVAKFMDSHRKFERRKFGYDKEYEERQVPVTQQVSNSKRGQFLQAPQVGEWAEKLEKWALYEKFPERAIYEGGRRTNHLQHGRHYG